MWYLLDPTPSGWCKTDAHSRDFKSEDLNQHLKNFLKLGDSLNLDSKNRNQVQRLMKAHLTSMQPTQVNKITSSCKICSGPHEAQYCMENPEQAFVEYASSRTDETGGLVSNLMASQDVRLSKFNADFKQQQSEMTNKIDTMLKAITDRISGALPSDTTIMIHPKQQSNSCDDKPEENKGEEKNMHEDINTNPSTPPDPSSSFITKKVLKLNSFFESLRLALELSSIEFVYTKG
uniref:MAK10-like protein n=1 Tax=Tanacetum cinerariifolium TaxID=118510 RepID=A0A6L2NVS7_TANCI|nr:MAK10-like protein [Tanacetum cinerariifolium]